MLDMGRNSEILKVAFVGWGRIAQNHLSAIRSLGVRAELVAIADPCPSARDDAHAKTGAPVFEKMTELLSSVRPDVVAVLTPSGLHPKLCIEAMRAGCHAISEKPMATTWTDGVDMVRCADEFGRRLFVVKQNRFNPTVVRLKRAMDAGRFGRVHLLSASVFWHRPQSYYDAAPWRGTSELDGGAISNQASHYVDLLQWIGGKVVDVQSIVATLGRAIEMEDTALVSLRYSSGALGQLSVSMLTYPANLEGSITVMGSHGTARIAGSALNRVEAWQFADSIDADAHVADASYEIQSVYGNGHGPYYGAVWDELQGIEASGSVASDGRDGLKSLAIIQAAYESHARAQRVSLSRFCIE